MTVRHPMRSDCDSTEAMLNVQFIYFVSLSIPDYSRHFDCQGRPSRIWSIKGHSKFEGQNRSFYGVIRGDRMILTSLKREDRESGR